MIDEVITYDKWHNSCITYLLTPIIRNLQWHRTHEKDVVGIMTLDLTGLLPTIYIIAYYSCTTKCMRCKVPSISFFFGVRLVRVNLCLHTFTHMTVTLCGVGDRRLFQKNYSCWKVYFCGRRIHGKIWKEILES